MPRSRVKEASALGLVGSVSEMVRQVGIWACATDNRGCSAPGSARGPAPGAPSPAVGPDAVRPGGASPATRNTSALAHGYEITTPDATTITNGIALKKPITLCQLKSRAFPDSPPRNQATLRTDVHVTLRGHQSHMPLSTINRNARFAAPVAARPKSRVLPLAASQRCTSVVCRKNPRMPIEPAPSTSAV